MVTHQWRVARYKRELMKIKAVRQRTKNLIRELRLKDADLLTSMDQRMDEMAQAISESNYAAVDFALISACFDILRDLPSMLISSRRALGWSQDEFAMRAGCTRRQIGKLERSGYESLPLKSAIKIVEAILQAAPSAKQTVSTERDTRSDLN